MKRGKGWGGQEVRLEEVREGRKRAKGRRQKEREGHNREKKEKRGGAWKLRPLQDCHGFQVGITCGCRHCTMEGGKTCIALHIPFLHNSTYLWSHVQLPCPKSRWNPSYLSWHFPEPICQQDRKLVTWICPIFVERSCEYLIIQERVTSEGN